MTARTRTAEPKPVGDEERAARERGWKIGRYGIKLRWVRSHEMWVTIPGADD